MPLIVNSALTDDIAGEPGNKTPATPACGSRILPAVEENTIFPIEGAKVFSLKVNQDSRGERARHTDCCSEPLSRSTVTPPEIGTITCWAEHACSAGGFPRRLRRCELSATVFAGCPNRCTGTRLRQEWDKFKANAVDIADPLFQPWGCMTRPGGGARKAFKMCIRICFTACG
jgi:hypothetical protein